MEIGATVKYYFPKPAEGKEYVTGTITFIGGETITILCDDNTRLNISLPNISRLHVLKEETLFQNN